MNIFSYFIGGILTAATLIAGLLLKFRPPKKINSLYGFKTKATSKNQETWDYGHKICANTLLVYSAFSILLFLIILCVFPGFFNDRPYFRIIFGLILALTGVIVTTVITQMKTIKYGKTI